MTAPTTTRTPDLGPKKLNLLEGQYRPHDAGDYTVTVQCARFDAAYTVTSYRNSYRLEDQCVSAATEQEACLIARGYCEMFAREAK